MNQKSLLSRIRPVFNAYLAIIGILLVLISGPSQALAARKTHARRAPPALLPKPGSLTSAASAFQPFAPAASTAYAANENSNNISVIDTTTNTVTATVPVGSRPVAVAVTPDGSRIYVANFGDGTVSIIDAATNTVIATVVVGSEPISIAINPNGSKLYVANFASGNVSVIDTLTNTVTASIAVGDPATPSDPSAILVSPDGMRVYVTNQNQGTVSVIDTSNNTVVATITVGDRNSNPTALTIAPNGSKVYVALFDNAAVSVIATATNTVTVSIPVGSFPSGVAVTPDGRSVYVTSQSGNVSVIDAGSNTVTTTVAVGGQLIGIAASPDGTSVYAAKFSSNTVSVISVATNNVTTNIAVGQGPYGIAISGPRQTVPPSISKSFGGASIPLNGTTALSFTINNPNSATTLNGIAFTDTLPAGLVLATPNSLSGTCGGTITAVDGSNSVSLSGAGLSPNSSCSFSVNVTGIAAGAQNNTTGAVNSTNGGTGNTASASITVVAPAQQSTSLAYVANENSNDVSVIDTATNAVVSTVPVGVKPVAAAILPDRSKVYVANFGDGTVSVINTATNVATATITVGSNPIGVAITPNGLKAYVANFGSSNVSVINTATNAVTTSIPIGNPPPALGSAPSSVAITPDGTRAYVTNFNNSTVSVIDTGNDTVIATIGVGAEPIAVAIAQDGTTVYVANFGASSLSAIFVADNSVRTISVGPSPAGVAVTPDGSAIYVTSNTANNVSVVTTATNTVTTTIAVGSTPVGAAITPDGATVYVANSNSNTASAITVATNTVAATIPVGRGPFGIATPRALPPTIVKSFGAASIANNGTTSLSFTITNPNITLQLTGIAFTDNLPTGLVVATPNGLTNTCGGVSVASSDASSVSLSGVTLAAGASCNLSVNVTATSAGTKNNSVTVISTEGGAGNTSNATLTVTAAVVPPTINKSFNPTSVPLNTDSTLTFTITNPNTTAVGDLTGVAFSDSLPVSGGPGSATLVVSGTPSVTNTCGGTVMATAGTGVISLSGASVAHNTSCTLSVKVTGTVAGDGNNTTGAITSTEGGTGTTSNTATLKVVSPPSIAKRFSPTVIKVNGASTITFSITNPNVVTINASFTDDLTSGGTVSGLVVASTPGVVNGCGGSVTANAGATSISFLNAALPVSASPCTITVNVTGTSDGIKPNSVTIDSTDAGNGNTATASPSLTVINPPTINKVFGASAIPLNSTTSLTFTITNPNSNAASVLNGISFTDTLPNAAPGTLVVAAPNNLTNTCSTTPTATAGSGSVSLTGASLAAGASCTISVNVKGTVAGLAPNSVTVSDTIAGTGNTSSTSLTVVAPPTINKAFNPTSVPLNTDSTLTFTITNPNTTAVGDLTGVAFSDTLPVSGGVGSATLVMSGTPSVANTCGGTVTATAGTGVISLSGASVAHNASCTLSVNVTGTVAGDGNNTTGAITSTEGGTGTTSNTATLKVVAPPSIAKAFSPTSTQLNNTSLLTFTITNPAANTVSETGVAFTDTLPTGLTVASNTSTVCGGTLTTTNPTGISLTGATIAVGGTCQFNVTVTGATAGQYTNTTGAVSSTNGGTGNTASANLIVVAPPVVAKVFNPTTIPLHATTTLTITITNPAVNTVALSPVTLNDILPTGLTVASAIVSDPCGLGSGVLHTTAPTTIQIGGVTIPANGQCVVNVTVTGATAGQYTNTTGSVSSGNGGTGNTATANLTVIGPPSIAKVFNPTSIPKNGTSTVTFTINNPNTSATANLSGVAFSDTLPVSGGAGSATLVVASTPNVSNTCGGTVTATAGSGSISLSGGSVAHNTSCTLSVDVKGTVEGDANNTTGAISSTEGGTGTTSNTATLKVVAPPTISKAFGAANITLNGTTTVTFTITNPAGNTSAENGIAFSDTLTNGLQVASTPGVSNTCGGTVTAAANSTSISLTGGSIATPGSTCTIVVNVTGTQSGTVTNTTGAVSSTNGGTGATSNTATLIVASPPVVAKAFAPTTIPLNSISSLTINITNPNNNVSLTGLSFTDSLPVGLVVASTPNLSNTCGGTASAVAGSGTVSLSGGALASSASCTVSVNVQGTTAGVKNNTVAVSSNEGGTGNTSSASLTVVAPPTIAKSFGAATIPVGGTTSLTFIITNPNSTVALSGIAFGDSLPAGLSTAPLGIIGPFCGGTVQTGKISGVFFVSLSGGTLPANGSCSFSINMTGVNPGHQVNTTGVISANEGGNGTVATASIDVLGPPTIAKSFTPGAIPSNTVSTLAFTITNPAANPGVLTGVGFTDILPASLVVATPNGLSGNCGGGTITATTGSGTVSLSGASIVAGSSCTFSVNVTGPAGTYTNTTGPVSSANGGTGNTASATLIVATSPTITKAFSASNVALNGSVSIFFSISNPNPNLALSGISFTDSLPATGRGAPPGLVVASPNGLTSDCTGTVTAVAGSSSISLSGATLPASGSCSIVLNLRATNIAAAAGLVVNVTGPISSNETGPGAASNTATVAVVIPPNLSKSFAAPSLSLNGATTLTFNVSNGNTATTFSDLAFTDLMPAGLAVASPNGMAGTCLAPGGGVLIPASVTAIAGSHTISMALLRLAGTASCSFSISVTGTQTGNQINTTGNITAAFDDGSGDSIATTGNSATASINITAGTLPPSISKAFSPTAINVNATSVLSFTLANPAGNTVAETGVAFTDVLPAGLTVPNGTSSVCGGTLTVSGSNTISLSGATIAANANCVLSVTVTGTIAGQYMNITSPVSSSNGGTGNTAAASISVIAPPVLVKSFGASSIPINGTPSLAFTVTNPNSTATLSNLAFSDTLPSGLIIASPNSLGGSCFTDEGGVVNQATVTAQAGGSIISLSGLGLAGSGSCSFSLLVTAVATGSQMNATSNITGTFDNGAGTAVSITGSASTAIINVVKADATTTLTSSANPSFVGQAVTLTATVSPGTVNPTGTVTFLDGGSPIGSGMLSGGIATFTTSTLAVGSHTITTSYGGDSNFNGSTGSLTDNPQIVTNVGLGPALR